MAGLAGGRAFRIGRALKRSEAESVHENGACGCFEKQTVDAVQHTAVARNRCTAVLGPETPLHPGFEKIPGVTEKRNHRSKAEAGEKTPTRGTHIDCFRDTCCEGPRDESRPSLVGREFRHQLRPADQLATE